MNDYVKRCNEPGLIDKYGAHAYGAVLLTFTILYYPVLVIALQHGIDSEETSGTGFIAGLITFVIIVSCQAGILRGSPICGYILYGIYIICLLPALEFFYNICVKDGPVPVDETYRISGELWVISSFIFLIYSFIWWQWFKKYCLS